jgi:hypothetical protein
MSNLQPGGFWYMIDENAGRAIGNIIVREVLRLPPLLAVAISYETAQTGPAMYLA